MANAWEQVGWIAAEALNYLTDALIITQLAGRDETAEFNVRPNGYRVGSSIDIRTNPVYEAKEFDTEIEIQDILHASRQLTIEKHFDISVQMTAREKRMDFETFSTQIIRPAAYAIAESCDRYVGSKILGAHGLYVSDNLFGSAADMALAKKAATFQQLNPGGRFALLNDTLEAQLLGADFFATHNKRGESGVRVFNEGSMGSAMGMEFFSSLNFPEDSHTAGDAVAVTDNGTGGNTNNRVGMSTLTVDGTTASQELSAGDRLQIAGVRRPLIVADAVADMDGVTSISLVDPIMEIIPDNAAVTVIGSGGSFDFMGAIFDSASIAVASPMLDPASDKPTSVVTDSGYSIRVVQGYDMIHKTETISLDMIIGAKLYDPRRVTLLGKAAE